eukprot:CAMPEP_0117445728 /NCGR_PEP_ID=MMETSP0759-20121206/5953_1 /TAXON_ID=63605 /ORGANISM="Percolomonas cosmopolitus, Strain WS" /LENGTH=109 /DNA_ID=CAMNT_0005237929 /DNA_START=320 /DNA_END=649 /DNA_ORIENTATION=+
MQNKSHIATWHSWFGVAVFLYFCFQICAATWFLYPRWYKQSSLEIRQQHRSGGRILLSLAWIASFLGWYKVKPVREAIPLVRWVYMAWVLVWGYLLIVQGGKRVLKKMA